MAGIAPKRSVAPAARGQRFAVVVARFNEPISKKLLDGALAALADHAVTGDLVEVHWVPGSFELGQAAFNDRGPVEARHMARLASLGFRFSLDKVTDLVGSELSLTALLLVDGADVTVDKTKLAAVKVTAEVVDHTKGPKIHILKYKNKTGYRKRQGHRQRHSRLKVTGIETGK